MKKTSVVTVPETHCLSDEFLPFFLAKVEHRHILQRVREGRFPPLTRLGTNQRSPAAWDVTSVYVYLESMYAASIPSHWQTIHNSIFGIRARKLIAAQKKMMKPKRNTA